MGAMWECNAVVCGVSLMATKILRGRDVLIPGGETERKH